MKLPSEKVIQGLMNIRLIMHTMIKNPTMGNLLSDATEADIHETELALNWIYSVIVQADGRKRLPREVPREP